MSAIVRPDLSQKVLAFPFLSTLILLLALACGTAASPVTPAHQVSTGTPVADGVVQTPTEEATPTSPPTATPSPTSTAKAVPTTTARVDVSKNTAESNLQSGGTDGNGQAVSTSQSGETSDDNQAPAIPDKGELKYPNLGSRLDQLVVSVESGETTAEQAASATAMHSGESVAVTIYLSGGVDDVVSFLEENGGDPRNAGEDYIEAYVPVTVLGPASEQPGVLRVREIIPPEREQGG